MSFWACEESDVITSKTNNSDSSQAQNDKLSMSLSKWLKSKLYYVLWEYLPAVVCVKPAMELKPLHYNVKGELKSYFC